VAVVGGQADASEGTLRTGGTVELLQLGGGQVFWQELWADLGANSDSADVDLEPTPAFPGKLGRVGVFDLSPGAVSADAKARTIAESGISLTLQASAASDLNKAFAVRASSRGRGRGVSSWRESARGVPPR